MLYVIVNPTAGIGKAKKLLALPFSVWGWLRNRALPAADYVTTECELFRQMLTLPADRSRSVYLCAEPIPHDQPGLLPEDHLQLCYLGSINNVISIPDICSLIAQLTRFKPVTLHIIGSGEQQDSFVRCATEAGAIVRFHGPIFDEDTKKAIMDSCHFGLNIMKSSVCVGLTMKYVDYFRYGLPIINNIPADTRSLILRYGAGFDLEHLEPEKIAALSAADYQHLRENVRRMFLAHFDQSRIEASVCDILNSVLFEERV